MANSNEAVARELGALTEALARGREDRLETGRKIDRLAEGMESVAHRLAALEQSSSSTATAVSQIATEKCGQRLDRIEAVLFPKEGADIATRLRSLESTVGAWRRWIGSGKSFAIRALLVFVGSAGAWAFLSKLFQNLIGK